MQTENIFIAHPTTPDQINALKAVVKALKVKFEIKKEAVSDDVEPSKSEVLGNIRQGFKELKLIQQGKLKTTSAKDFLNEL
jgi:hypothetical protein